MNCVCVSHRFHAGVPDGWMIIFPGRKLLKNIFRDLPARPEYLD